MYRFIFCLVLFGCKKEIKERYDGKYKIEFLKEGKVIKSYIGDKMMNTEKTVYFIDSSNMEINVRLIKDK